MRWVLTNIYSSFEAEDFKSDLVKFEKELSEFLTWMDEELQSTERVEEKLEYVINKLNELSLLGGKLYSFASLTLSADANNETAAKYLDIIRSKFVDLSIARTKFRKFLKQVEIENLENTSSEVIKSHMFVIKEQKMLSKYMLSENEERIINMMRLTGGNDSVNL
jgi:oligoendopeptidase F